MRYKDLNSIIKNFIVVVFLYGLTSASFNGFFGIYLKELGHPESAVGAILSLKTLSVGVFTFLIALISQKIGHKKSLIMGLFTVGISSILIVIVDSLQLIKLLSVVFGFGQAAMLTIESPFIYNQTNIEERVHAFSLTFAARNTAFMAGSLITGFMADIFAKLIGPGALPMRYALVAVSCMSLIAIVPLLMLKPNPTKKHKRLDISEIKGFFTKTNTIFLIYSGIVGLGAGMVVPFFGVYLKYVLDTTDSIVGAILSFSQLGTVIGGLSVPFLSKRIGSYKTIIATQLLSIPALIAIGFPQGIVVMAIAFFLRSSLMNMGQPLIKDISMGLVSEIHRPMMSAMEAMVNNLSRAIGIYFGGLVMARFTYNTPYAFTIFFYIAATSIFFSVFKDKVLVIKTS